MAARHQENETVTIERALVVEHRITTTLIGLNVRYWIESDPVHGGVASLAEAHEQVQNAEDAIWNESGKWVNREVSRELALFLLRAIPSANSIEVCGRQGNGVAVHRDWP